MKTNKNVKLSAFFLLLLLLILLGSLYSHLSHQPKVRLIRAFARLNKEAELWQTAFYGDLGLDEVWKDIREGQGSGQASVNLSLPFLSASTLGLDGPYAWNVPENTASWEMISSVTHIELLQGRLSMDEAFFYAEIPELLPFPLKGPIETILPGFSTWRDKVWSTESASQKSIVVFLQEVMDAIDMQSLEIVSVQEGVVFEQNGECIQGDIFRVRGNIDDSLTPFVLDIYLDPADRIVRFSLPESVTLSSYGVEMKFTLDLFGEEESIQEFGGTLILEMQDGRTVTIRTTEKVQLDREEHAFAVQVSLEGLTQETLTLKLQGRFTEAVKGESVTLEIGKFLLKGEETTYVQVAGNFQIVRTAGEVVLPKGSRDFIEMTEEEQRDVLEMLEDKGQEWLSRYGLEEWEW